MFFACLMALLVMLGVIFQAGLADNRISTADKKIINKDADKSNWVTELISAAAEHDADRLKRVVKSAEFNAYATMTSDQGNTDNIPLTTLVYVASVVAGNDKSGQMLRIFLDAGGNPNAQDAQGNTTLHMAVGFKHPAPIRLLLSHGGDPDIKNHAGISAREMAQRMKLTRVLSILREGGNAQ